MINHEKQLNFINTQIYKNYNFINIPKHKNYKDYIWIYTSNIHKKLFNNHNIDQYLPKD